MGIINFLKKRKEQKEIGDPWVLAETVEDGFPIMHRLRQCVPDGIIISEYPYLLSILWEYETEDNSGMPSEEQNEQHLNFDDALDEMDNKGSGTMMLAITGNGRKEWVWYVNDPQEWSNELHSCLQGHPVYPLDIEKSEDPEWETWKTFRDNCK